MSATAKRLLAVEVLSSIASKPLSPATRARAVSRSLAEFIRCRPLRGFSRTHIPPLMPRDFPGGAFLPRWRTTFSYENLSARTTYGVKPKQERTEMRVFVSLVVGVWLATVGVPMTTGQETPVPPPPTATPSHPFFITTTWMIGGVGDWDYLTM